MLRCDGRPERVVVSYGLPGMDFRLSLHTATSVKLLASSTYEHCAVGLATALAGVLGCEMENTVS